MRDDAMSDEQLADWRADALDARRVLDGSITIPQNRLDEIVVEYAERYVARVPALIAEVERLRAENRQLHAGMADVARAIVDGRLTPGNER